MKFTDPLIPGTLLKRYKRFLVDVELADKSIITAHCPNPGSMKSCLETGWPVRLFDSQNPQRKLRYTLEMVYNGVSWIGVNTQRANALAEEAIQAGRIAELPRPVVLKREVKYGQNSRIDLWLDDGQQVAFVEVKNVTMLEQGCYQFPDAKTERGLKHLRELSQVVAQGQRGVMLFVVQREDGVGFRPADSIDPIYAQTLREVSQQGVEILCYQAQVNPQEIILNKKVDIRL